jgi:hypothetical protein
MTRNDIRLLASALAKLLDEWVVVELLNVLETAEADPRLTDDEAEACGVLYDLLTHYRPDTLGG